MLAREEQDAMLAGSRLTDAIKHHMNKYRKKPTFYPHPRLYSNRNESVDAVPYSRDPTEFAITHEQAELLSRICWLGKSMREMYENTYDDRDTHAVAKRYVDILWAEESDAWITPTVEITEAMPDA
jgi:hypothetical protein